MISTIKRLCRHSRQEVSREGIFTFLNPYSYLVYRNNRDIYNGFDGVYFDGIVLCWAMRLAGIRCKRVSFDMTSLAPDVFNWALKESKTIFFVGATQESVEKFSAKVEGAYPGLSIKGFRSGYFLSSDDLEKSILELLDISPDVVVVGMGAPLQEEYLLKLRGAGWKGLGYTCGGFIHQTANGGMKYYPEIFDVLNLRWLYRIYDEPKLLRRYLIKYPQFLLLFFFDLLVFKMLPSKRHLL